MTRINSAISVKQLTDEHLLAEHREIKRVCSIFHKCRSLDKIPKKFCLGSGHILFFMDKFLFTKKRYVAIYNECKERGFDVENYLSNWDNIPIKYCNDYIPTNEERYLLQERIKKRILDSSKLSWHYYKKSIDKNKAIKLVYN